MLTIMSDTDKVIAGPDVSSVGGQQPEVKVESAQTETAQPQTIQPESSESVQPEGTTEKSTAAIVPPGSSSSSSTVSSEVKTTVPISSLVPDQFKGSGYEDVIPYLERKINEYKPLSEEDLKKLRRRQKAEGIISGISDAVRSVANLIFTNQYAPDMYKAENGMSARAKARFDKEKAEREANDDKWFNYVMTLGKLKNADRQQGLQIWQTEQSLARQEQAYVLEKAKAERDQKLADLNEQLMKGRISEQEAKAREAKIIADYAEPLQQSLINKNNRSGGGGGNGKQKTSTWLAKDTDGKVHQFEASSTDNAHSIAGAKGWQIIGKTTTVTSGKDVITGRTTKKTETQTGGGFASGLKF